MGVGSAAHGLTPSTEVDARGGAGFVGICDGFDRRFPEVRWAVLCKVINEFIESAAEETIKFQRWRDPHGLTDGCRLMKRGPRTSAERQAEFLLSNAVDVKDYAKAVRQVRKLGLDPAKIRHRKPRGE